MAISIIAIIIIAYATSDVLEEGYAEARLEEKKKQKEEEEEEERKKKEAEMMMEWFEITLRNSTFIHNLLLKPNLFKLSVLLCPKILGTK